MSTYTPEEIRGAILRAADRIEGGAPYDFDGHGVDGQNMGKRCGPCMWGHIGRELSMSNVSNIDIAEAIGVMTTSALYELRGDFGIAASQRDPAVAAKMLRAFADAKFPAAQLDPAFLRFRESFTRSVEAV